VTLAVVTVEPPRPHPELLSARKFLADFKPIESLVDGMPIPRGGLVSITGPTGSGKTTLCTALQVAIRLGRPFAGRDVTGGSVAVLAGENPDDYAMHLMATLQDTKTPAAALSDYADAAHFVVVPGTFNVMNEMDWLESAIGHACSELAAVFVDTSAAYFSADDENDNVAMRRHASMLRELTTLPGRPTVFVLCHPTKNATRDNLLPRGGGAFLAEVDANLTVWKDEAGIVSLHWAGKIRGSSFDPLRFELVSQELDGLKDCRGKPITSVAARHLPDERAEMIEAKELDDGNRLLVAMLRRPDDSQAKWAMACGFTSGVGTPNKAKVNRLLAGLVSECLVEKGRGGIYRLSVKGKKEAERHL
jgi:energy-coupling factor transporter ATP-binding protein EcfA2